MKHRRQQREHRRGRLRRVLRRAGRPRPAGALEPAAQDHAGRAAPDHAAVALEVGHRLPAREARRRDHHDRARRRPPGARARQPGPQRPARSRARRSGAPIQYLGPGESAPAHRHTPSAIRFVMTGSSVYTTVDGDACEMEAGDLILTPNWKWHDHNNYGDEPMVWFDGLDLPLMVNARVDLLREPPRHAAAGARPRPLRAALQRPRRSRRPARTRDPLNSPLLRYSWANTERQLEEMHALARRAPGDGRVPEPGHRRPGDPDVRLRDDAAPSRARARRRGARPAARCTSSSRAPAAR